ncbi:multidrug and toxic compound extrusion (MATE) family protein [Skeletonema marinoi]|uniref:Multidrug and toxic compound extrusion (MATE) family protein n=1 Tax=Skeletonema marinoi TaxID=267567 RepID=A0AAD9DA10_9STRA|nr:multidrug and toxic compound extrusion (MATE) family protein [Skeletonema marinoi]
MPSTSLLVVSAAAGAALVHSPIMVEALALIPSPLSGAHAVLRAGGLQQNYNRKMTSTHLNRRRSVSLNFPLNYMNMEEGQYVDPINVTDPSVGLSGSLGSVLDLVDNNVVLAAVDAVMDGHHQPQHQPSHEDGNVVSSLDANTSFLPKELPIVEEDVRVIESPELKAEEADHPSVKKIIQFTLPAIGVWLCSPVLSMIDTASVGMLAGTAQQAALNPAVSVTDYGAILVAFMYTATTNLIAGSVEKDREEGKDVQKRTTETLITALRLALLIGVVFGTTLSTFAPKFLSMLIGNDTLDPTVFSSALRYVRIRCLGMPAAVVIGTAQSACLGMKDVRSPLYVLAAAAGINLIGDLLLVGNSNPWLGGASGAAWATVFSQWGAMAMFLKWLTTKAKAKEVSAAAGLDIDVESDEAKAPARGVLASKYKPSSILKLSSLRKNKTTNKFLPFLVPVTTTSIGRVSGYLTMSHVASSALGTLDMAAHQIAISIFCCLSPLVDALNTVAQSFVPSIFARPKSKQRALALRKTSLNFAKVGAMAGLLIVTLVTCGVPLLSRLFTTDPRVLSRVKNAIPGIAIFLGFDGLMSIGEGTLLGHKDLAFLRNSYATFFFLVPAFMLRLKRKALKGIPVGLGTMWGTFSAYEVVRTVLWLSRVAYLQRKTESEAKKIEEEQGIGATL